MLKIIDISDWEYLNKMRKTQIELDSLVNILSYLISHNYNQNIENYKYYQSQYFDAYDRMLILKNKFIFYLKESKSVNEIKYNWNIDFLKEEVSIYA